METIGQILKNAREKKGISIEELESSTHIVSKFIKALESDDFEVLPGEVYVKGFIKNLSDKLSLDSDIVFERYNLQKNGINSDQNLLKNIKSKKYQKKQKEKINKEIEEVLSENESKEENKDSQKEDLKNTIDKRKDEDKTLKKIKNININNNAEYDLLFMAKRDLNKLRNQNKSIVTTIIFILAIIVVIAVIIVNRNNILSFLFSDKNRNNRSEDFQISRNIVDSKAKQNVKVGDIIYFKPLGISATIKFNNIGNVVHININDQDLSLSRSNPVILDLNGNGINDFKISIIEVYDDLATVEMEKLEESQVIESYNGENIQNTNFYESTSFTNLVVINGETYIEQYTEKVDIKIEITAKHFVYIRYFIDSNRPVTTNLLSGKTLYLEAKDIVMLTIGNAGETIVKINGKIINVGASGETINKTIKWVKNLNDTTRYNLIMSDTK